MRASSTVQFNLTRLIRTRRFRLRSHKARNPAFAEEVAREAAYEFYPDDYFRHVRVEEIFEHPERPFQVDLGSGYGSFLLQMAQKYPEQNFLAVEREGDRVDLLCRKALRAGVKNLKVLHLESGYTVKHLLPNAGVDVLHVLFPDPWPKKRHHKRRIINAEFRRAAARVLRSGGELRFATDHEGYFRDARRLLQQEDATLFSPIPWPGETDAEYPTTDFQRIWSEKGKRLHFLALRRA
jgi:tRNA (guanine-N7-)-methyltransferase